MQARNIALVRCILPFRQNLVFYYLYFFLLLPRIIAQKEEREGGKIE